jgi:hypothetical protein
MEGKTIVNSKEYNLPKLQVEGYNGAEVSLYVSKV